MKSGLYFEDVYKMFINRLELLKSAPHTCDLSVIEDSPFIEKVRWDTIVKTMNKRDHPTFK